MEIQLTSSAEKLIVTLDAVTYELKKPTVGQLKKVIKPEGGDSMGAMENLFIGIGFPQEKFDGLYVEQLNQLTQAVLDWMTAKKN